MQKFIGQFKRFIYKNEDTNFYVALFMAEKNDELDSHTFSVSANRIFEMGIKYEITVTKSQNSKYANTYTLQTLHEILPNTKKGIINYLSSNKFPSIGKVLAEKIVNKLGINVIEKIKEDPILLDDANFKLTEAKKTIIINGINANDFENKLIHFFYMNNLSLILLKKIIDKIGAQVFWETYAKNPYQLWIEKNIFSFNEVNELARYLNFAESAKIKYLILDILFKTLWDLGSTKLSLFYLFKMINQVYLISKENYALILKELIELDLVYAFDIYLAPTKFYKKEIFIVNYLRNLQKKIIKNIELKKVESYFDEKQKAAIIGCIKENVAIITGQPGTGKTEILKTILKQINSKYQTSQLAILAPTGRAAYQITLKSNYPARTIHSFLGWQVTHFKVNADDPVEVKILVIDEFSMVDTNLLYALLSGITFETIDKIILIGDKDQIPSIGEGYILNDLIDSKKFAIFRLKNNYRQRFGSNIFDDANLINKGQMPLMKYEDCYFIESTIKQFEQDLEKTFDKFYPKNSIEDITILAPMYEGGIGINWINNFVQNKIFKDEKNKPIKIGEKNYFIGDKVIQLENDLEANVFNGEIGYLDSIIFYKEKVDFIIVRFPNDKLVKYSLAKWNKNISLAYAISIHKFQGSESLIVIMILFEAHSILLSKKLFYTGITRAKNNVVIIGEKSAIQQAVNRDWESARLTNLQDLLKKF